MEQEARIEALLREARQRPTRELAAFLETACGGDTALRREVEARLVGGPTSFMPTAERLPSGDLGPQANDIPAGGRVGRYRILRVIGRGGMGTVDLAERADEQFEKQVALKLVGRGQDSETVLRLFRQERQILANLDHPNIARLLDGGATEDGAPYVVMEHVEGEPIEEHCAHRGSSTAERVRLFRTVCAAVQYAHQNLVVHRDLKPSNILVTAGGVPKLLDFGIAKVLTPQPAATQTLTRGWALTPYYASPEQVRGETISTATDVYSLGVVLYELLTGRRPYEFASGLPHEITRVVSEQEPARPSDHARPRELRGDLDDIVLMALRKEPARRYASVEQLSEDLRRHLEGLPVIARTDTLPYRAGKFVRRHRVGVAASVLVALSLLGGIVATTRQARVARAQKARAERRFDDVRKLARSSLFEIHDEIQDLPGATRARARLVTRALEYLDSLAQEASGDDSLQAELAEAYLKVGDVQGRPGFSNLGDRTGALASYKKAVDLREALRARHPRPEAERELATALDRVGDTAPPGQLAGRPRELPAIAADRRDAELRRDLSVSHDKIGRMLLARGDGAAALARFRQALALDETASRDDPASAQTRLDVSADLENLGNALVQAGRLAEAEAAFQRALELRERVSSEDPANAEVRAGFVSLFASLGLLEARRAGASREPAAAKACARAREWHDKALRIEQQGIVLPPAAERSLRSLAGELVRCPGAP